MEDLGAGFYLAMHDLEIRGAGEILGESQSGEMQEIGFSLYTEMLDAAVNALKRGVEWDGAEAAGNNVEVNLHAPALLPDTYCGDIQERLVIYKRLANCDTPQALQDMQEELIDRFGLPPPAAHTLLECHRLRLLSRPLGIAKIDASGDAVVLQFAPNPPIPTERIVRLIQGKSGYQLAGPNRLRFRAPMETPKERVAQVLALFRELNPD
jgi:transcription-repair coupling factor (superfamily II helicase)